MRSRLPYAVFGVLATLVGMATGHLVASLMNPASSPVLAVGSAFIDATPTPLKEWAISHFGSNDKIVLIGSVLIVVLILAAVAGLLARIRFVYGAVLLVILVAVAGLAALSRPAAGITDLVPALFTAVAGVATLYLLHRLSRAGADRDATGGAHATGQTAPGATRRSVLVASGVLAVAAIVMAGAGKLIGSYRARPEDIALPAPANPQPALPQGIEGDYPGVSTFATSTDKFYRVDTRLDVPVVDADTWTLTIDGDVDKVVTFTLADLLAMPLIERDITLTCVSNSVGGKFVGSARWLGVRLTDLLDMAGVGDKADQIFSTDVDGMTISTPLALAADGRDAMIAVAMNGVPLPREHGFPARMVVPGLYGFISATKWVTKLTLTTYAEQTSYWTERKWATDAPIKISSRIDTPGALADVKAGDTFIGGVAWAQQNGGVGKVQVKIDGGAWEDAQLGPSAGNDYWRQWYYPWNARTGRRTLAARVIDGNGETQTAALANPFPGGSSGIHSFFVNVV